MITRERFIKIMNHIKMLNQRSEEINAVINKYDELNNDFMSGYVYDQPDLLEDLIIVLTNMFNDKEAWISYWVYELNCGLDWEPGYICDGSTWDDIPLQTPEDLWDLLQERGRFY